VIFASDSRLRVLFGFARCTSLSRLEIPASVEKICHPAFAGCSGLTEVIFANDSRLILLDGFRRCASLSRLKVPASVEQIGSLVRRSEGPRRELIFRPGTQWMPSAKGAPLRGFVIFEDENDLKRRRRQAQMTGCVDFFFYVPDDRI
jgi:hypothetical protein